MPRDSNETLYSHRSYKCIANKSTTFSCLYMGMTAHSVFFHFSNFGLQNLQNCSSKSLLILFVITRNSHYSKNLDERTTIFWGVRLAKVLKVWSSDRTFCPNLRASVIKLWSEITSGSSTIW